MATHPIDLERTTAVPHPLEQATITVEHAGQILGVSRPTAYAMANEYENTNGASGLPVIRCGRRLVVPTAALWRLLHLDPDADHGTGDMDQGTGSTSTSTVTPEGESCLPAPSGAPT